MKDYQKTGGVAALINAAIYLVSIVLLVIMLTPMADADIDFDQFMSFYLDNQAIVFIWHLLMYMLHGVFLAILALALYDRLKTGSPAMAQVAVVFGLLWAVMVFASGFITKYGFEVLANLYSEDPAQAATLKLVLDTITLGLDHSDRFLGCLWVLFVSWTALRSGALPKPLNILGLVISVPGIVSTAFPGLGEMAYVFGLGIIVWWIWLGIVMLRSSSSAAA